MKIIRLTVLAVLASTTLACGSGDGPTPRADAVATTRVQSSRPNEPQPRAAGSEYYATVKAQLARSHEGPGSMAPPPYSSPREAMPTTPYRHPKVKDVFYASDAFIVGRLTSVTGGSSFAWPDGPDVAGQPSGRKELPFNSAEAMVSTVVLDITVEESVTRDASINEGDVVRVGVVVIGRVDTQAFSSELSPKRLAVILVKREDSLFKADPRVLEVLGPGAQFLGEVEEGDIVSFPHWHDSRGPKRDVKPSLKVLMSPITIPTPLTGP